MGGQPIKPDPQGKPPKKEMSMEIRLLLAFLLMGLVLFLTPYIYKPPPGPKPVKTEPTQQAQQPAEKKPEKPEPAKPAAPAQPVPGQIQATSEQEFTVNTDIYRIRFSNHGAVVKSWVLKSYVDHAPNPKPLELVNQASFGKVPPPFSLTIPKDDKVDNILNYGLWVAKHSPDGLRIDYEFSDGKNYAKKSFEFTKNGYLPQITTEVTINGT